MAVTAILSEFSSCLSGIFDEVLLSVLHPPKELLTNVGVDIT